MASQPGVFNPQAFTDAGAPAASYRLYTYTQGTTTHKTAYADAAGLVPHTYTSDGAGGQYIQLNARGELPAPLFLASGPYDLALKTPAGVTVWTRYAEGITSALETASAQVNSVSTLTVSGGTTAVTFPDFLYTPGANALLVFADGQYLTSGVDYTETSESGITLTSAFPAGTTLTAVGGRLVTTGVSGDLTPSAGTTEFNAALAALPYVYVPDGAFSPALVAGTYPQLYGIGAVVDTTAAETIEVNPFPQTGAAVKAYKPRTFGRYENAVGASVTINSGSGQARENTQVMGTSDAGLATYQDRDHVGLHVSATSFAPTTTTAGSTTYTSTTVTAPEITSATHKPGMIIDTLHGTPYVGVIRTVSGTTATVGGWYQYGTGTASTPANGTAVRINPNTKVWGANVNVFVASGGQATKGVGIELGISATKTGSGANTWGYDCITLSGEKPAAHFISRGSRTVSFLAQTGGGDFGFLADGQNVGVEVRDPTALAMNVSVGGVNKFTISNFGQVQGDYRQVTVNSSATYTILSTDAVIVNVTGGAALTLPAVTGLANRIYTIVATAATTIKNPDGTTLKSITSGATAVCACDGSFWY